MVPEDPRGPPTRRTISVDGDPFAELASPGALAERDAGRARSASVPSHIGRYAIGRVLGAGGMGEVFAATDDVLGRELAIKLVHAELDDRERAAASRLMREAQTLAQLNHPNVVQIYEVGTHDNRVYLAMEVVIGATLRQWSRAKHGVPQTIAVLADAARGLHAVHRLGLVHRDVKPDNIIIGNDGRVRVVDFGLTRFGRAGDDDEGASQPPPAPPIVDPSLPESSFTDLQRLTITGAVVGTPVYMAPEQLRLGVIDARCDQFAFCVMAWEVLAGARPFASTSLSLLFYAHRRGPQVPTTGPVPPRVWQVLQRGLAYESTSRWPDMEALVDALERAMEPRLRWPRVLAVAGLAAAAIAVPIAAVPAEAPTCFGVGVEGPRARASLDRIDAARRDAHAKSAFDLDALATRVVALAQRRRDVCLAAESDVGLQRVASCLDRAMHRVETLIDQASVHADAITEAIAGLPDAAECDAAAASGTDRPEDPEVARQVEQLRAELDDALTALALGRAEAVAAREPGLVAMAEATGFVPLVAEVAHFGGAVAIARGHGEQAREKLLVAADLAESSRHDVLAADAWAALAELALEQLADAPLARTYLRRAEASAARIGVTEARARMLRLSRAQLAKLEGDIATAQAELAPLLAALPSAGDLDPTWWPVLGVAADVAEAGGNLDGALELHMRHRAGMLARLADDHVANAMAEYNIGKVQLLRGEPELARASLERAQEIWTRVRGADHPDLALVHTVLQQWEMQHGTLSRARDHAQKVLTVRLATLDGSHPDVGLAWLGVGAIALLQGDADAATRAYHAALSIHERALGPDHPQTALVRVNLGEAMLETAERERVLPIVDAALATLLRVDGIDPSLLGFTHRVRAQALGTQGAWPAAAASLFAADRVADANDPLEASLLALEHVRVAQHVGDAEALARAMTQAHASIRASVGESAAMLSARLDAIVAAAPAVPLP